MTLLVSWISVDSGAPASIYLMSDSRITWGEGTKWGAARKLFVSRRFPDIFGYCGEVLFVTQILSQVIELIDAEILCSGEDAPIGRFEKVSCIVKESFESYPRDRAYPSFSVIHCSRDRGGLFHCFELSWSQASGWETKCHPIPERSGLIGKWGSGKGVFNNRHGHDYIKDIKDTSRGIYIAAYDAIRSGEDPATGDSPQLVAVYARKSPQVFGVILDGMRSAYGLTIPATADVNNLEWRNDHFERCDGETLMLKPGAQKQPVRRP